MSDIPRRILERLPAGVRLKNVNEQIQGYFIVSRSIIGDDSEGITIRLGTTFGLIDVYDMDGSLLLWLEEHFFDDVDEFVEAEFRSMGVALEGVSVDNG